MKIAIISSPYSHPIIETKIERVNNAKEVAMKWWREGYNVVSPVLNTAFMDNAATHDIFVQAVKELMDKLLTTKGDVIVMCEGWGKSAGCKAWYKYAIESRKEVRFDGNAKREAGEEEQKPDKGEVAGIISGEDS